MGRTTAPLPDGCESKVELVTRYLAMNHGEEMSAHQLAEAILEKHGVEISEPHLGKIKKGYYASIGKKLPPARIGRPPIHSPRAEVNHVSPSSILSSFVSSVKLCGGVAEAKRILELLEAGSL